MKYLLFFSKFLQYELKVTLSLSLPGVSLLILPSEVLPSQTYNEMESKHGRVKALKIRFLLFL